MDREKEVSRVFDAIMFGGYKSFLPDEDVLIPKLENITVFIGKNNSGKSSILDVIGAACNTEYYWDLQNKPLKMVLGYTISESMLKQVLSNRYGESSYFYGIRKYVGVDMCVLFAHMAMLSLRFWSLTFAQTALLTQNITMFILMILYM